MTPEDARRLIGEYVEHYNTVRLHSAISFITPADLLAGRQQEILEVAQQMAGTISLEPPAFTTGGTTP